MYLVKQFRDIQNFIGISAWCKRKVCLQRIKLVSFYPTHMYRVILLKQFCVEPQIMWHKIGYLIWVKSFSPVYTHTSKSHCNHECTATLNLSPFLKKFYQLHISAFPKVQMMVLFDFGLCIRKKIQITYGLQVKAAASGLNDSRILWDRNTQCRPS